MPWKSIYVVNPVAGYMFAALALLQTSHCPPKPVKPLNFDALGPGQMTFFASYQSSSGKGWANLDPTQQLEFAGATQALDQWAHFDKHAPAGQPGMEQIKSVTAINGSIPGQPSQNQFNVQVTWQLTAPDRFEHAWGWDSHITLGSLHPNQYGFQQSKDGDPFLGIVVLFDKDDSTKGQFHVGLADLLLHYVSDNGNIAEHYDEYCDWYGPIAAYLPGPTISHNAGTKESVPPPPPPPRASANIEASPVSVRTDWHALRTVAREFVTAWYVKHADSKDLNRYVATDNEFTVPGILTQLKMTGKSPWQSVFTAAFSKGAPSILSLKDAIQYSIPSTPGPNQPKPLNVTDGVLDDPFAVLDPSTLPHGTLFPNVESPARGTTNYSPRATYLNHLRNTYSGKLYLVVYSTKGPSLIESGFVLYWILEGADWKLAMLQPIG